MKEIEVKFKVNSFDSIRAKLKKMGAGLVWEGMEESYFFDTRSKNLRKRGTILRLRRWDNHSNILTVKTKAFRNKKYKIKHEYEIEINDIKAAQELFFALGFVEYFRYKKYREHWRVSDASIELDKVEHLLFVEIEASPKEIDRIADMLGLRWENVARQGYIGILEQLHSSKKRA